MKSTSSTVQNSMLKYLSWVTLTVQSVLLCLSMRYARSRPGDMFLPSSAVVMTEVTKLITCLCIICIEEGSFSFAVSAVRNTVIKNPIDTLKVSVPSFVYIIQNNLLYVSASHLDAVTYQVPYQVKILSTAMFAVLILHKSLYPTQCLALMILVVGVVFVQLAVTELPAMVGGAPAENRLIGFLAALCAGLLSGFAGIYFEKILKGSDISVWMRNVQLSFLSLPLGLFTCILYDWTEVTTRGFFFGYDAFVWYLILLQGGGGLIVAIVVKYADNIVKSFATSLAIVMSCICSVYLFDFELTVQFALGAALVIFSIFLYGHVPNRKLTLST